MKILKAYTYTANYDGYDEHFVCIALNKEEDDIDYNQVETIEEAERRAKLFNSFRTTNLDDYYKTWEE